MHDREGGQNKVSKEDALFRKFDRNRGRVLVFSVIYLTAWLHTQAGTQGHTVDHVLLGYHDFSSCKYLTCVCVNVHSRVWVGMCVHWHLYALDAVGSLTTVVFPPAEYHNAMGRRKGKTKKIILSFLSSFIFFDSSLDISVTSFFDVA